MLGSRTGKTAIATFLLLSFGSFLVAPASASYEQVQTFTSLSVARGAAVNITGAGGVPAGTVYVINPQEKLATFKPNGEPAGEVAVPISQASSIAIDQATGNLYAKGPLGIIVLSPDGKDVLTTFGESAPFGKTIAETPEMLHQASRIGVDSNGVIYVADLGRAAAETPQRSRVMVFAPETPGDFEHYEYVEEIAVDFPSSLFVAADLHGNLFTADEGHILKFDLSEPEDPVCKITSGGIQGVAIDPESGEVVYASSNDHKGHQLVCNPSESGFNGQFKVSGQFAISPPPTGTQAIEAWTLNPAYTVSGHAKGTLYASNDNAPGLGYIFAQPLSKEPVIESEWASTVGESTATVNAEINPKGSKSEYVFQYLTEAAYQENEPSERFAGALEAPAGGAPLPVSAKPVTASAVLSGLALLTSYRYRVVAFGEEGEVVPGGAASFKTYPSGLPVLPDERAYELVSPSDKQGGEVIPAEHDADCGNSCKPGAFIAHFPIQGAPDGESVVYQGFSFSHSAGAANENEYLSHRTPGGWQTSTLSPLLQGSGEAQGYKAFDAGLHTGILYQRQPALTPSTPAGYATIYAQSTANPLQLTSLLPAEPEQPFHREPGKLRLNYVGGSSDYTHLYFEANDALTEAGATAPAAVDGGEVKSNLYEWSNGDLRLVNVAEGNTETAPGAEFGSGVRLEAGNANAPSIVVTHAISEDGSVVFWTSGSGQLAARVDAERTLGVGAPGICSASLPVASRVCFLSASADGSRVLLSNGQIYGLNEAGTEYLPSVDLTAGEGGFRGLAGQDEDLSTIYFVDTKALAGENAEGSSPVAGENNLYAWRGGSLKFVDTPSAADEEFNKPSTWSATPTFRTAEASPDGDWLAFRSVAPLTGFDNTGACGVAGASALCREVFLYDLAGEELSCPSCNRGDARPLGGSTLSLIAEVEGASAQPRYLTDAGRLYFNSSDSLTPFDTNNGVEDVYQYEPQGIGTCKEADGCVALVSAGREPVDSSFMAMDATGANVFFSTRDRLVPADTDELIDIYDAREHGGIGSESLLPQKECLGDGCQPQSPPPPEQTSSSSGPVGPGNVRPCRKGQVRRGNRCVKKGQRKKKGKGRKAKHSRSERGVAR